MNLAPIAVTAAASIELAAPKQLPGDGALPDDAEILVAAFAELLAAGIALPATDAGPDGMPRPAASDQPQVETQAAAPALPGDGSADPLLGLVLAALALPAAQPDGTAAVPAEAPVAGAPALLVPPRGASPAVEAAERRMTGAAELRAAAVEPQAGVQPPSISPAPRSASAAAGPAEDSVNGAALFRAVAEAAAPAAPAAVATAAAAATIAGRSDAATPDAAVESVLALPPAHAAPVHALHADAARPTPVSVQIHTPFGQTAWNGELTRTVVWMAGEGQQVAEVRLNPPDLGPLEIVLRISGEDGGKASVSFASPHADVRTALETALPRLREMLAASGIALGHASVSAESFRDTGNGNRAAADGSGSGGAPLVSPPSAAAPARASAGLVDLFA